MMRNLHFEISRLSKFFGSLNLTTMVLQLLFLYFFALVGRFDRSDDSNILTHPNVILALATTGTMCALAIYGTVVACQVLVGNYVGTNKSQTYLLPVGRKSLFYTKLAAFSLVVASAMIVGLFIANLVFNILESLFQLMTEQPTGILDLLTSVFAGTFLTIAIILLSSFIGIKLNGKVKSMIASIVLVVLFSNLAAITMMSSKFITLIVAVVSMVIVILVGLTMGNGIENDEVL
ncbi:hypothetical protein [Lacticaseibacillus zeae]|uniref:ABC transporter permease n=2 Tax=Lacticaseibacillus zeae TaxID=57037 RepID=A0ABD7Z9A7_LACZE|nr:MULTISPECIES: hypothetical protein [unclassified Lacticaseibacillus]WLV83573.1 hypothetical protein LACZS2_002820 [Lacticaseibacillus sp. NCIMB 15475]WLV86322.1 hypothetical protein LACZS1_002768 [Lacticaseibacillus sp. NCIMB 15474]